MSLKERLSRAAALSAVLVSTLTTSGVETDAAFAAANAKKSAAPMDVEEMYETTLKVEDLYARATDQYSDGVNPLADDKDSYESWNWKALVDKSGTTTSTKKTKTKTKAPRPAAKKKAEKPTVSDATLKALAKQRENAEKLERAQAAQAEREAATAAKKKEAIAARDAAQSAAVEARRAAARAAIAEREQQAAEEIAERQAAREEQRARMDKLREKSEAERKAEQREYAAKQRAAIGNTKKPTATKKTKKTNARRAATAANNKKPTAYKKRTTTPKKKYGGSLDRNSFRNVKRQRGGASLAAPALFGTGAYIYYLLLQEEED